ncbi:MAG: NTP transferase domain-containing protein [Bifidobacteriaceae bacterium]|jgi:molybdopterin-guanine dinucleotide biosynthesis protein A|nr:NTP transferase domain-containing protein [Bifidobacteriaceae bacterium]
MTMMAVVLAGGRSRRLGGTDKASLTGAGGSLLSVAVGSCSAAGAERVVVVGPERPLEAALWGPRVIWTCEQPRFGGPARGIAAGVASLGPRPDTELVIVLACDMPGAGASLARLVRAGAEASQAGVLAQGPDGRDQWLFGVWRLGALAAACGGLAPGGSGESVRSLLGPLSPRRVRLAGPAVRDVDTWRQARELGYQ